MASSVGGAISEGLESGLRLGMGLMDRRRGQERQDEQDRLAREDRELRLQDRDLALKDREELTKRQRRSEGLTALDKQAEALRAEGARFAPNDTSPEAQAWAQRVDAVSKARSRGLADAGGYNFEAEEQEAAADLQALQSGQGANLPPARRVRAIVAATRRPIGDFLRVDGKPSKIGGSVDDFANGLANGDEMMMLAGANTILAPDLQRGIGEDSPHGGKIVGKRVVGFDPAPGSTPDNPKFIPRLQVYVKDGKPRTAADLKKIEQLRAQDPGAPEDATGYYIAPVTEDRSSRPDAKVKLLDLQSSMKYLDNLRQLEELLNDPAVAAEVAQGAGEWNQDRYLQARSTLGLPIGREKKTEFKGLTAGGALLPVTTDDTGKVTVGSPINGPEKQFAPRESVYQMAERMATENGTSVESELAKLQPDRKALADLRNRTDPNRARGLGGSGGRASGGVQSSFVGSNGNRWLLMRDGTQKDTGIGDASFNGRVAALVTRMSKDNYEFRDLPVAEQRKRAVELLGADLAPASPVPASSGAPPPNRPPLSSFMR